MLYTQYVNRNRSVLGRPILLAYILCTTAYMLISFKSNDKLKEGEYMAIQRVMKSDCTRLLRLF